MPLNENAPKDPLQEALRQCRIGLFVLITFGFFINMLLLVTPLYMIQVFDRVLSSQQMETLLYLTLAAGFALAILGVLETVRSRVQTRMGNWIDWEMSAAMIGASVDARLAGFDANAQPLRDLGTIRSFISGSLKTAVDLLWAPLFIVALWFLHPWFGWFALGIGAFLLVLAVINELIARKPIQESNSARMDNEALTDQVIRNADVVHSMGMLQRFLRSWDDRNREVLKLSRVAADRNATLLGITRFVRLFAQTGVLGMGAYFVIHGELTAGAMIAGSILLGRALAPIEQVMGAWRGIVLARAAHKRLKLLARNMLVSAQDPMPLPVPKGHLWCEDVWYSPSPEMEPTIKGVSFKLEPGEAMALMGPSASGKSTLCRLLVGSWKPAKGNARLDGADIYAWPAAELGPHVGYLPQDVELFAATVKENIARLNTNPNPGAVVAAAKAADVHEMILALPDGYDTMIGPDGVFLSGGQRQRLALARALYGKPRLIVLDEPNSNLDKHGEDALVRAIETAKGWHSTVILVTHHTRLVGPVDKVMVLRAGERHMYGEGGEVLQALLPKPPLRIAGRENSPRQDAEPGAAAAGGLTD